MARFAGHNVVCDHEIDLAILICLESVKGGLSRVGCPNLQPSTVEDGFARERLYRVIIDDENHRGNFLGLKGLMLFSTKKLPGSIKNCK